MGILKMQVCCIQHEHSFPMGENPEIAKYNFYLARALAGTGNVLFSDTLNTFYLRLYGVGHMVKDHSDSDRGNPLPPHALLFPINSNGYFICTVPQTG